MDSMDQSVGQPHSQESVTGGEDLMECTDNANTSQNTSSTGEGNTSFRDFATNYEFDICKVNAWKLPKVMRGTKEWEDKERARGLLKRRRSDRHDKSDTHPRHSTPTHSSPPHRKRPTRNFVNSNYKEKLLKEHGYDIETRYQKAMASYSKSHVTNRKGPKK